MIKSFAFLTLICDSRALNSFEPLLLAADLRVLLATLRLNRQQRRAPDVNKTGSVTDNDAVVALIVGDAGEALKGFFTIEIARQGACFHFITDEIEKLGNFAELAADSRGREKGLGWEGKDRDGEKARHPTSKQILPSKKVRG